MSRSLRIGCLHTLLWVASACFVAAAPASAREYSLHILHAFCSDTNCRDGKFGAGLVSDATGNLYGATPFGGANSAGTIFELSRTPDGKRWTYQVLHDFCAEAHCHDGAIVEGPLVVDSAGALYGITNVGGRGNDNYYGVIFRLSPNADRTVWAYQVLMEFCPAAGANCDSISSINYGVTYAGAGSGARYDGISPLYGTSYNGGLNLGGTVFSLSPPRPGHSKWRLDVIHAFCLQIGCPDGESPGANVVVDPAGILFGTTTAGGANGAGVLFELQKSHGAWTETVLHDFCSKPDCTDGKSPTALTEDVAGNLMGASVADPNSCADPANATCCFGLQPAMAGTKKSFIVFASDPIAETAPCPRVFSSHRPACMARCSAVAAMPTGRRVAQSFVSTHPSTYCAVSASAQIAQMEKNQIQCSSWIPQGMFSERPPMADRME